AISEITSSTSLFMNKQATLSNLMKNASGSRVVHLATHGYLNERAPEESSILLADNKLTMPQIFNLPLDKTDMIVLSACETGKGASKGMEYATIARAFANAGSPTVLATLWKVDDIATRELMVNFYGELKDGSSKLMALTNAQRQFLKTQKDKNHPYYWAAFILMGKP
ncbi:MAG: CHAT domain-containing protein, partial [Cyclobacteriaceae bacterium]